MRMCTIMGCVTDIATVQRDAISTIFLVPPSITVKVVVT